MGDFSQLLAAEKWQNRAVSLRQRSRRRLLWRMLLGSAMGAEKYQSETVVWPCRPHHHSFLVEWRRADDPAGQ